MNKYYVSEEQPNMFQSRQNTHRVDPNNLTGWMSINYDGGPKNANPSPTQFNKTTAIPTKDWYGNYQRKTNGTPHAIKDQDDYDPNNAWDNLAAEVYDITHL